MLVEIGEHLHDPNPIQVQTSFIAPVLLQAPVIQKGVCLTLG